MSFPWNTTVASQSPDVIAPDGSEIRFLVQVSGGSTVHCTLPPGCVTQAVRHRTVEETWYFLTGHGQVWRKSDDGEQTVDVYPGLALSIPLGTDFQFRAGKTESLTF